MITLQLIDVPLDADVANPQGRPLGSHDQVATRLSELLPGTSFDAEGRGTFQRGAYQIAFKLTGDPATAIGVAFEQPDAFTALKRIVDKTGWCLIDPMAKGFVDIDLSRAAGRTVMLGEEVAGVEVPAASPSAQTQRALPGIGGLHHTRFRLSLSVSAGVVIGAAAVIGAFHAIGGRFPVHLSASILAGQKSPTNGLEKYSDRVHRREAAVKLLPAAYRDSKVVEQLIDFQMASRAYWNSVGDGRFSSPELLSNTTVWSRYSMQTFLPPAFAERQRNGYDFEFAGDRCEETEAGWPECQAFVYTARPANSAAGAIFALSSADDRIHVRTDGRAPTLADPTIDK